MTLLAFLAGAPGDLDPFLPARLRPVVERAVEAELDPKRGPDNGAQLLRDAMLDQERPDDRMRLELRMAAIQLRKLFLTESKLPEPKRYQQALTTFTRLELTDPGIAPWVERVLEQDPEAGEQVRAAGPLRLAVLVRKPLPAEAAQARLQEILQDTGTPAVLTAPKKAEVVVRLRGENAESPDPNRVAIKTTMDIAFAEGGKVEWKHRVSQTSVGADPDVALAASLEWLLRIGGRDLYFHWLGEHGLPMMITGPMVEGTDLPMMPRHDHGDDHGH